MEIVAPNIGGSIREPLRELLDDLDVLLRHRLLRQPGGFEGFLGGWVSHCREDHSVAEREDVTIAVSELTGCAALRSKPVVDDGHDLVPALEELQRLNDPSLETCAHIGSNLLQGFASPMRA